MTGPERTALREAVIAEEKRRGLPCYVRLGHETEDMRRYLEQEWTPPQRADWSELADDLNTEIGRLHRRENQMLAAILLSEEGVLLGQRCRLSVEWPDGLPHGFTATSLRKFAEQMKVTS